MKKMWFAVLIAVSAGTIFAGGGPEETFGGHDYGNFESVDIRIPAETVLERGSDWAVVAEIPERYDGEIRMRNDGGTLVVDTVNTWLRLRRGEVIRFVITMPEIEDVRLTSSGSIVSKDEWAGNDVQLSVTGSGDMRFSNISAESLNIRSAGSGDIEVASVDARDVQLRATGSGDVGIGTIDGGDITIELTGSGNTTTSVRAQRLDSSQTGSGSVSIDGTVDSARITTTGSGTFRGGNLEAGSVSVRIFGSGDVEVAKGSDIEEISMLGSGRFRQR